MESMLVCVLVMCIVATVAMATCPDGCHCNTERKVVDCRNAGLTRIPWDLPDPSGLKQLDLSGNQIREIIAEVVSYVNLEYLDLSDNELLQIDDNVLDALPNLKFLYLQNNKLSSITQRTLQGLTSLVEMDLSHNDLPHLTANIFSDLKDLEDLNLAGNRLNSLDEDVFVGLSNLRYLSLSDNSLQTVPVKALERLPKLNRLQMDYNKIETITSHAFKALHELQSLSLEDNGLLFISEYAFHERDSEDLPHLERLSFRGNQLQQVPPLGHMENLVSLDLSENPIASIPADAFKSLVHLRTVYLNTMPKLHTVQKFAFAELNSLSILEMHSNRMLTTIEEGAFIATPKLHRVDLHANMLSHLSANLFDWSSLDKIDLRYNPWHCDCHLQWMREIINVMANQSLELSKDVTCATPEHMASKHIADVDGDELKCKATSQEKFNDHIMVAIFATVCGVLLFAMICLLYKYDYFSCLRGHNSVPTYRTQRNLVRIPIQPPADHRHCNGHAQGRLNSIVEEPEEEDDDQ